MAIGALTVLSYIPCPIAREVLGYKSEIGKTHAVEMSTWEQGLILMIHVSALFRTLIFISHPLSCFAMTHNMVTLAFYIAQCRLLFPEGPMP
jgi:hypothetical protein